MKNTTQATTAGAENPGGFFAAAQIPAPIGRAATTAASSLKGVAKRLCLTALLLPSIAAFAQPDPNFHIYLMFGQSNMEGQGQVSSQDRQVPAALLAMQDDDNCTQDGAGYGQWRPATPPLIRCFDVAHGYNNGGLGPGDYFGRTMLENSGPDVVVGLVGAAYQGQGIDFFRKNCAALGSCQPTGANGSVPLGQGGYAWLLDLAQKAQQDGVIKGIIFHQGESDTGDGSWPGKVNEVVTDLRNDLGLDASEVPFIAGEMVPGACCTSHNSLVHQISTAVANGHWVSADGLGRRDNYHFDAAGYREIGRRYAQKMLELIDVSGGDDGGNDGGGDSSLVAAVNAGSSSTVTFRGVQYQGDQFASGGTSGSTGDAIAGTNGEDALFQTERYGSYTYQVPVAEGIYSTDLHFAEIYWEQAGQRSFSVSVEGMPVLTNFDLFSQAGHDSAFTTGVDDIYVSDGNLTIQLETQVDNATLSGFAVRLTDDSDGGGDNDGGDNGGGNTLVVRARGTSGEESISLKVGGSTIATWTLSTGMSDFTASTDATGAITVEFTNDADGRDVQVDLIQVNGETRQAEDQSDNTGAWGNGQCGGGSNTEWLHCNGAIGFGELAGGDDGDNGDGDLPLVLAVNAGSGSTVAFQGVQYQGDQFASGGSTSSTGDSIAGANGEDALFQTERYGTYTYQVPVTEASYSVDLHFAEIYWEEPGQRSFSVSVEGTPVLDNIDLFSQVGHDSAFTVGVDGVPVSDGNLTIQLETQVDNGTLSGFVIRSADGELDESGPPAGGGNSEEFTGADCPIPSLPSPGALGNQGSALPDPFMSLGGSRIATAEEWRCRRAEIKAQVEAYEMGVKPFPVDGVSGSVGGGGIMVTVQDNGGSISFTSSISTPGGDGPYPAVIGIGGNSLNTSIMNELGIATITFDNNEMGGQSGTRGQGKFFDLYGSQYSDSSIMAWAWGVSRLIDALESTPEANIDTSRLAVTGCSRNGKGALYVGAFDERIALTIPQESGAGGTASWRVSQALSDQGQNIQTASSAHGEQPWFDSVFGNFTGNPDRLPFDHHMVMAMVAPRALLTIDNPIDWLGPESTQIDGLAAKEVWSALGLDANMGVSQTTSQHSHCVFPSSQDAELRAFLSKFLLGVDNGNTDIVKGPGVNTGQWINWSTPNLQ